MDGRWPTGARVEARRGRRSLREVALELRLVAFPAGGADHGRLVVAGERAVAVTVLVLPRHHPLLARFTALLVGCCLLA